MPSSPADPKETPPEPALGDPGTSPSAVAPGAIPAYAAAHGSAAAPEPPAIPDHETPASVPPVLGGATTLPPPWTPPAYTPPPQPPRSTVSLGIVTMMLVPAVVAGSVAGYIAGTRAPHVVSGLVSSDNPPKGNVTVAESLAMIDAAKKVGPATVTITSTHAGGSTPAPTSQALGTGIIFA